MIFFHLQTLFSPKIRVTKPNSLNIEGTESKHHRETNPLACSSSSVINMVSLKYEFPKHTENGMRVRVNSGILDILGKHGIF